MAPETDPPFQRIAAELRRRITTRELAPGERVPSTRRIAQDWGVALATATKALTVLRLEGLVEALPRVGTVVAGAAPAAGTAPAGSTARATAPAPTPASTRPTRPVAADGELSQERIVRAALELADAEGLAAVSMRAVAARLGVSAMSPYRYVTSKEELVLLTADAAFGDGSYPDEPPAGWRARLELGARTLWSVFRRHPWLAQLSPVTRPLLLPNLMTHAEWALSALDGHGLSTPDMLHAHVLLYSYIEGIAVNLEREAQARAATGVDEDQWMDGQLPALGALADSGRFPVFSRLMADVADGYDMDLDALFEFGLANLLDGLAPRLEHTGPPGGTVR
ncbi:TetR/AcrR family transcriptional regulator C-terminal domain-containing protein [Streptomyces sp. CB01881]|uniref:TetR/AcrR family transcriptional regulator C-terminal domain-containing protein n=1 Tax=Streptomyces sp. CB01881 TaxID=2078691 RepID=UPI000CDC8C41|nr:TetR/AcrR family transcriptional regulator C-terminal domain-containing protein [Streptomyces sp. CB01881]AUY49519.1 GntR family transcriptional regulator [Streptomyces sp. CB01881]TYC72907.1 GntR family transcriptional regulator [Streptomyces sp. CB01881]